jgi:hypothetical protein
VVTEIISARPRSMPVLGVPTIDLEPSGRGKKAPGRGPHEGVKSASHAGPPQAFPAGGDGREARSEDAPL